ncbi:MAG: flagellar basal-body MS-ring/collar protein FliF [Candidatus Eremiobacteraeota bacterium]|nr:flagellar basal-body MS-ring/collar protein FliF [Candidatus Eremiobacteraeota bacterium]
MATGIQTGMRTATREQQGSTAAPSWAKMLKLIESIPAATKRLIMIAAAALIIVILAVSLYGKASAYVPLYDFKLTARDTQQITLKLSELGIPYATGKGDSAILVPPAMLIKTRLELQCYGLPRKQAAQADTGSSLTPLTDGDKRYIRHREKEEQLTEIIRQFQGVADVSVLLVIPEKDYFDTESREPQAAIMVQPEPGAAISSAQVKGIEDFVSSSVENLRPAKIKIVDDKGILLNRSAALSQGPGEQAQACGQFRQQKAAFEGDLEASVQDLLDKTFGQGRTKVAVNATLDFSTSTRKIKRVGGIGNTTGTADQKTKIIEESYDSKAESDRNGALQVASGPINSGKGMNYRRKEIVRMSDIDTVESLITIPAGRVERITASVVVDNFKPAVVEKISETVKNAIGYDGSRGDSVSVVSIPIPHQGMQAVIFPIGTSLKTGKRSGHAALSFPPALLLIPVITLIIGFVLFLLGQNKLQLERSRLVLAPGPTATASDITDLINDRSGRASLPRETLVGTSASLEKLAAHNPAAFARMLKSTIISEKNP